MRRRARGSCAWGGGWVKYLIGEWVNFNPLINPLATMMLARAMMMVLRCRAPTTLNALNSMVGPVVHAFNTPRSTQLCTKASEHC